MLVVCVEDPVVEVDVVGVVSLVVDVVGAVLLVVVVVAADRKSVV